MAADGLFFRRAARLHPRYQTPVFALWFQAAVSLVLLTTNTYDQLLSYVVFADWLFFGLTAGALLIVRAREPSRRRGAPAGDRATLPGHPWTTGAFIAVAAGDRRQQLLRLSDAVARSDPRFSAPRRSRSSCAQR